ncbi:MAG: biotin carboxylase, partial [Acidimicrobiia bacterium]|nr:biotin carboxylase [Acidimicrobiia bacterium]
MEQEAIQQILDARAAATGGCPNAHRRLAALFDGGFVEYGPLAGQTSDVEDAAVADGLVGGAGDVCGHPVVAASYDRDVLDGTQSDRNQ